MKKLPKYQIIYFIIITYILTFIGGQLYFNQDITKYLPKGLMFILKILFIPAIIAPFSVALLFSFLENGLSGIKNLFKRFSNKKTSFYWYLLALVIPMLVYLASSLIDLLRGNPFLRPFGNASSETLFFAIQIFLLAGIGEEMGWRGYLLPKLQQKINSFYSSIIVGLVTACWHIPLFFQQGTIHSENSFFLFLLLSISVSFLYTFFMDNTGSVLIVALFHTSHDIASINFSQRGYLSSFFVYTILTIIILIIFGVKKFTFSEIKSKKLKNKLLN